MRPRHRLQLPRYGMHALGLPIATGHAGHPAARRTPPNVHPPRTRRARRQRQGKAGKARQGKARQGRGRTFAFLRRAAPPSAMPHAPASSLPLTACVGSTGDAPLRRRLSSPSPSASASAAASLRNRSSAVSSFLGLAAAPPPARSPGADVAGVGPVPVQMWQGWTHQRRALALPSASSFSSSSGEALQSSLKFSQVPAPWPSCAAWLAISSAAAACAQRYHRLQPGLVPQRAMRAGKFRKRVADTRSIAPCAPSC